ncbi:HD domain-containing protein [Geopsychrobacter electrodiphilus]|uniref:HD domain-containing protein n=1 Tax=Geopsychrobacter electrodiphilus TaxID=225196 RepID=UPI00036A6150|nr:HD domain-containing protein [Geopsychrobacter electrodiphilus]
MMTFDEKTVQRMTTDILELLATHYGGGMSEELFEDGLDAVQRALDVARICHAGQVRKSGEPYMFHPLRVSHLAARHWMDFSSVIAALLHDVVEDTPVTIEDIRADFGDEVALLVDGLTKVESTELSREETKMESYRKQILAAIADVRVLCLKFWDRIDNLQTISALPPIKQKRIAEETREIYVPLANHLGMGYVANTLDSLSLYLLYPRRGVSFDQRVEMTRDEKASFLRRERALIINACEHQKVGVLLKDRWRPFSILAARQSTRGFSALYTLEAQVDSTMDAYIFLGVLHSLYSPIPGKLRDHLVVPSQHGYQSLKTTVQAGEQRMRVEITTRKLARFNESGVLAPGFEFRRQNFRNLMKSLTEGESAFDTQALILASKTIQVYTPLGESLVLPEGSSALDFAFDIHETVGIHAVRARINGQTRLLKTRLLDGDQIEIETSKQAEVLPKWLEWAVTPKARNTIRRYLRKKVKKPD